MRPGNINNNKKNIGINNGLIRQFCMIAFVTIIALFVCNNACASELVNIFWASAKAGPNQGWEGSSTKGAAITIWGTNFGTPNSNAKLICANIEITSTNADYIAEWGATSNPAVPPMKNFSRITFWLNSSMSNNNESGIQIITEKGRSNVYPFKIDNTGKIYFMSPTGSGSMSGTNRANGMNGSPGDFQENLKKQTAGNFLYLVGGTYMPDAWVGYKCAEFTDGTDDLRITLTNYPGEKVLIDGTTKSPTYLKIFDDYWTIANLEFNKSYIMIGDQKDACNSETANHPCVSTGMQIIGCEMYGDMDHSIMSAGDGHIIAANYVHQGEADENSYPIYLYEGDDRVFADNYISGGNDYLVHLYDEKRCGSSDTVYDRVYQRNIIERNVFDMSLKGGIDDYQSGINAAISRVVADEVFNYDTIIRNNIFFTSDDSNVNRSGIEIRSGIIRMQILNNTFYNLPVAIDADDFGIGTSSGVEIKRNIFSKISGNHIENGNSIPGFVVEKNLYQKSPSLKDTSDPQAIVGEPGFISTVEGSENFNIGPQSDAIDVE